MQDLQARLLSTKLAISRIWCSLSDTKSPDNRNLGPRDSVKTFWLFNFQAFTKLYEPRRLVRFTIGNEWLTTCEFRPVECAWLSYRSLVAITAEAFA